MSRARIRLWLGMIPTRHRGDPVGEPQQGALTLVEDVADHVAGLARSEVDQAARVDQHPEERTAIMPTGHAERHGRYAQGPSRQPAGDLREGRTVAQDVVALARDDIDHVRQRRSPVRSSASAPSPSDGRTRSCASSCRRTAVRRGGSEDRQLGNGVAGRLLREEVRLLEMQGAQVVDCHAGTARHDDIRDPQAGIGQSGTRDDGPEAVVRYGNRLLGRLGEAGDELGQVVGRRREVLLALDRPRRTARTSARLS